MSHDLIPSTTVILNMPKKFFGGAPPALLDLDGGARVAPRLG